MLAQTSCIGVKCQSPKAIQYENRPFSPSCLTDQVGTLGSPYLPAIGPQPSKSFLSICVSRNVSLWFEVNIIERIFTSSCGHLIIFY